MDNSQVEILVLSVGISKEGKKPFITFRVWNEDYKSWGQQNSKDGYADYFMFVTDEEYNFCKDNIHIGLVVKANVELKGLKGVISSIDMN